MVCTMRNLLRYGSVLLIVVFAVQATPFTYEQEMEEPHRQRYSDVLEGYIVGDGGFKLGDRKSMKINQTVSVLSGKDVKLGTPIDGGCQCVGALTCECCLLVDIEWVYEDTEYSIDTQECGSLSFSDRTNKFTLAFTFNGEEVWSGAIKVRDMPPFCVGNNCFRLNSISLAGQRFCVLDVWNDVLAFQTCFDLSDHTPSDS